MNKEEQAVALGRLIKKLQDQKGLTQGQLATYAKVGRPWLSKVQNGVIHRKGPDLRRLWRVADVLGVDPNHLWRELGIQEEDLLTDHPEAFQRDIIEFAIWLQSMPDEARIGVINGFRALKVAAEAMARTLPPEAEPPTPLPRRRPKPPVH